MVLKRILPAALLLFSISMIKAQSYEGLLTDNYNGVHGIISNPANIADSRLKMDINLIGVSAFFANDYIGFDLQDAFNDFTKAFDRAKTYPSAENYLAWNIDVLGPSVMLSINEKQSIAIYTRARGFFNVLDVNGNLLEKEGGFDESEDFFLAENNVAGAFNAWAEIGATYARVLYNNEEHFLKGGATLKYIQGMGSTYINGSDISFDYNSGTREVTTTGQLTYGDTGTVDDQGHVGSTFDFSGGTGFGGDLGIIYEWRPNYSDYTKMKNDGSSVINRGLNKYKLKLGMSITDIGVITSVSGINREYDLNRTQNIDNFDGDVLEEALIDNYELISETKAANFTLPTAFHTNVDWNVGSKFYLNLNASLPLTSKSKVNTNQIVNQFRLTPRFETAWLSIYSPIGFVQGAGLQWGTGLRLGPVYVGSGSIFTSLFGEAKVIDLFAGAKIPIYQNKLRDKDNDGIINQEDSCPEIAGPVENQGCPWEDTDKDGILDKDDDCPKVAGPKENNGCPWKDSDADGVLDKDDDCPETPGLQEFNGCPDTDGDGIVDKKDRCPETPGKIEYNGCPDTDGDTLPDLDDKCPNIAGPVSNNGCPEVTKEVQKQLNDYAKTILFDTGKATIKTESVTVMVDIIQILNEYPTAKFTVEGHTDSVGSNESNQKLSEARANSVRDFLINEGISGSRLTAIGYGEEKPIASNTTKLGRKQNRRVEINLIK